MLSFLISFSLNAQENKNVLNSDNIQHSLLSFVRDNVTHITLGDVKVELLSVNDSCCLFTYTTNLNVNCGYQGGWYVPIPSQGEAYAANEYILRFSKEGYITKCVNYTVPKLYKRETLLSMEPVNLVRQPKEQQLSEATVKATRVKFYSKGDTIVYNADAFQLNEGSMLDALIRQMSGVELKSDGRIYVNGKYVESLLLNGEDFFKGNNQVLLENLPTYMVKNVQVYNKAGRLSELTGTNAGDKEYVMDVKLKKQYSIGWLGNIETAGGTKDRYLARLFALRFTDHSRLSFYGGLNNLNETRKPGENTEWTPEFGGDGITTTRSGGIDYLIDDRNKRFKLEGNGELKHTDNVIDQRTTLTNFLLGGDTYGKYFYYIRSHNFTFTTEHHLDFKWKKGMLSTL